MILLKNLDKKMDIQEEITKAGFRTGTPVEKVKGLILQGKWKPTTTETIGATEKLRQFFEIESLEESYDEMEKSKLIQRWGHIYGLMSRENTTETEKYFYMNEIEDLQREILENYGLNVSEWGNPLFYEF